MARSVCEFPLGTRRVSRSRHGTRHSPRHGTRHGTRQRSLWIPGAPHESYTPTDENKRRCAPRDPLSQTPKSENAPRPLPGGRCGHNSEEDPVVAPRGPWRPEKSRNLPDKVRRDSTPFLSTFCQLLGCMGPRHCRMEGLVDDFWTAPRMAPRS